MKKIKILAFTITISLCVLLPFNCFAIDFDAEKAYDSIFIIYSAQSQGSGFAIGQNAIITNYHVIKDDSEITIEENSGEKIKAFLIAKDEGRDLALIAVENAEFTPLEIDSVDDLKIGEDVYAIGSPKGMSFTLTKGVLSKKDRELDGEKLIQFDAAINPGNSGGPLLDTNGKVIGVNTYKLNNTEGIGLAIPTETLKEFIKSNFFELNEKGNLTTIIDINNASTKNPSNNSENKNDNKPEDKNNSKKQNNKKANYLLIASVALNMVLILFLIILLFNRNKDIKPIITDKDRTDFEIDLLE